MTIRIRAEQMQALQAAPERYFIGEAMDHLREFDPVFARAARESGLRAAVTLGLSKARDFGFENGRPRMIFLESMCRLGSNFDMDPQYQWLWKFLQPESTVPPDERSRLLAWHLSAYRARVDGPEEEMLLAAYKRLATEPEEKLPRVAADRLRWLHPSKAEFLGNDAVDSFASAVPGNAMIAFLFGYWAAEDPLYPWIKSALSIPEPRASLEKFKSRLNRYLAERTKQQEGEESDGA